MSQFAAEKFTTRSREAIDVAQVAATTAGHSATEPIHLLAALLRQEDGTTRSLVTKPGVDVAALAGAASRWMGSVALWPAVVAATWATSIASRLRVVNFSAANWLIPTVGSSSRGFSELLGILADRRGDPLTQRS